jgi:hypothetical protein
MNGCRYLATTPNIMRRDIVEHRPVHQADVFSGSVLLRLKGSTALHRVTPEFLRQLAISTPMRATIATLVLFVLGRL